MYAVIETGGKQFRVELGTEIAIDRLDALPGETIELGRVLLLADGDEAQVGRPIVEGARVSANIVRQDRGDKLVVFKYRPKARRRVKHGHRQDVTVVRVADIEFNGRSAARETEAEAREREAERKAAEEEAARKAAADQALAATLAREQAAAAPGPEAKPARAGRGRRKTEEKTESAAEAAPAAEAVPAGDAASDGDVRGETDASTSEKDE